MLITFNCPKCASKLEIESLSAGLEVECPECSTPITVPRKGAGPGTTVGGFKLIKLIGKGGMGQVYLARQLSMDRDIALKILPSQLTFRKDLVERFLHEVRLQARLQHPNIVTAHEAGEDDGVYYLAMSYVKGEPLDLMIHRKGTVPEKEALRLVYEIGRALAYAWDEHKLLHRDIKPGNIIVDGKGNPHLLDLGLSKSLNEAAQLTVTEMLLGTPNYMSPEQAEGGDIDFRSDMYSLGMTLYHMLTGEIPFKGNTVMEILRKQATESLPDPRDKNPKVSAECVELMVMMLGKTPEKRYPSWEILLGDIQRVMAGLPPKREALSEGESTLLRKRELGGRHTIILSHTDARKLHERHTTSSARGRRDAVIFALVAAALLVLGLGMLVRRHEPQETAKPPPREEHVSQPEPEQLQDQPPDRMEPQRVAEPETRRLPPPDEAERPEDFGMERPPFDRRSPDRLPADRLAGDRFDRDQPPPGQRPPLRQMAPHERRAMRRAVEDLKQEALRAADEGRLDEAVRMVLEYTGPYADETQDLRRRFADHLRMQTAEPDEFPDMLDDQGHERLEKLTAGVATMILDGRIDEAVRKAKTAQQDPSFEGVRDELRGLNDYLEEVAAMPAVLLDTFRADRNRNVVISFLKGQQELTIVDVDGEEVVARKQVGSAGFAERRFTLDELSPKEKFTRLGKDPDPARDIMRGLLVLDAGNSRMAAGFFERAGTPLGTKMAEAVRRIETGTREAEAVTAYRALLRTAGLPADAEPTEEMVRRVRRTGFPAAMVPRIRGAAKRFLETYGDSEVAARSESLVRALSRVDKEPREADPAQIEEAFDGIRKLNPGVEILASAFYLGADGTEIDLSGNPALRDITPLTGLPVTKLNLSGTGVKDLEPLRGMPLEILDLSGCPVTDISALEGLALRELHLTDCRVRNIQPLKGMALESLNLSGTDVERISVLQGMPLNELHLSRTRVEDLRPLRDLPLRVLELAQTPVADIRDLATLKDLEHLNIEINPVSDIEPLEGLPLKWLSLGVTRVSDLSPLSGMPLEELRLHACPNLTTLAPLKGVPLKSLLLNETPVSDLSPLKGAPLNGLMISGCRRITDLTPVLDAPLIWLEIRNSGVQDYAQIARLHTLQGLDIGDRIFESYRARMHQALQDGDVDASMDVARRFINQFRGVPAFQGFVEQFEQFLRDGGRKIAAVLNELKENPGEIPSQAAVFDGHHYLLSPLHLDWQAANEFCEQHGAHLATITTPAEQSWVAKTFAHPGNRFRLGGTDRKREGTWMWVTGEPWRYENWGPEQPDNYEHDEQSLTMNTDATWNDVGDEWALPCLMEWDR